MSMFQKSVINKYFESLDKDQIENAYKIFKKNYNPVKIKEIQELKEEEYQDGFLRDIFVDVLGYVLKPEVNYNLVREFKNQADYKKADGAILKDGEAIAIIELKSTKTKDLKSITQQAFNYKNNQPACKYVITSNFQKLRFYIDYANEYEEFDLFSLNRKHFGLLYLILCSESIYKGIPQKLKEQSIYHEERVSKQLYKDYSNFKDRLFGNLIKNNSKHDKLTLFKKSQKLIDRFLFILFAEDRGLLPPNSIDRIIKRFNILKEEDAYKPLYDIYKQYFGYMNIGRKGKRSTDDISAYNGGLFYPDKILDSLSIDDDILVEDLQKLSAYDFNTDVDVNILGHIFEHSISEIEEIKAEIDGTNPDTRKSKRKKDGIFYTPKYITQYIIENTIGRLCEDKCKELGIAEIEIDKSYHLKRGGMSKKGWAFYDKIETYKDWLLSLKIVDPACGSGAFLNQALNFLINEHEMIIELQTALEKGHRPLFNLEAAILENNLYGVDINEESVEIAKLSLWLRTAQKGRKLSILSNNIKCGNSLIENPEVAGNLAFDWQNEFADIFAKGGFDVVIGNPPYIPTEYICDKDKIYLETNYQSAFGRINLYPIFYEKGIQVLKSKGMLGFITPYTILKNQYYKEARRYVLENTSISTLIDFKGKVVFEDAAVDSIIFILTKEITTKNLYKQISNIKDFQNEEFDTIINDQAELMKNEDLSLLVSPHEVFIRKIIENSTPLKKIVDFNQGIITGSNKKFLTTMESDLTQKVLAGRDFNRYSLTPPSQYVIYDINKLHRPRKKEIFETDEKILLRQTGAYPICSLDTLKHYTLDTVHNGLVIDNNYHIKFIISLLNSKLLRFLYESKVSESGKVFAQVKIIYIDPLPIKKANPKVQQPFIEKTDEMLILNQKLKKKKQKFLNRINDNLGIEKISKKLDTFYNYNFKIFIAELKKQKVKLSLAQQDEWEDYFTTYKTGINQLQSEINSTDKAIDKMVYELYELTGDEIKIIEAD